MPRPAWPRTRAGKCRDREAQAQLGAGKALRRGVVDHVLRRDRLPPSYALLRARALIRRSAIGPDALAGGGAVEGDVREALEILGRGLEAGELGADDLLGVPELEALRARPEFANLLGRAGG